MFYFHFHSVQKNFFNFLTPLLWPMDYLELYCYFWSVWWLSCFLSVISFIYLFVYLKGREMENERRENHLLLHSQMPTRAGAGPSWKGRMQSKSPNWVAGTQLLVPLLLTPRICISGKVKSEARGWTQTQTLQSGTLQSGTQEP